MASHKDTDALSGLAQEAIRNDNEVYQRLQDRGVDMLKRRLSTIAAGEETDRVLFERLNGKVSIKQLPADPDCLRISIGEVNSSEREKYIVFRGDIRRVRTVLQRMLREIDETISSGHF